MQTVATLLETIRTGPPTVSQPAARELKHLATQSPNAFDQHHTTILKAAIATTDLRTRWNLIVILGLLPLRPTVQPAATDWLFERLADPSPFTRTFAVQALFNLSASHLPLQQRLRPVLERFAANGTPSMQARARSFLNSWRSRKPGSSASAILAGALQTNMHPEGVKDAKVARSYAPAPIPRKDTLPMTPSAKSIRHFALPALALTLSLAGCRKPADTPQSTSSSPAQSAPAADTSAPKVAFVQHFYDLYAALQKNDSSIEISGPEDILRQHPEWFDPTLLKALKNDAAIQAKAKGEITGLDFDPFLASQEGPLPHYQANGVTGNTVNVIGYDQDAAHPAMSVGVQLTCPAANCVITNISYPAHDGVPATTLLDTLAMLHPGKK